MIRPKKVIVTTKESDVSGDAEIAVFGESNLREGVISMKDSISAFLPR